MTLRISGKNMDIGESLKSRIEDRMTDAVDKYFGNGFSGHVNMEKSGAFFETDCMLHLDSGVILQTSGRETDPHQSFEKAADRIEKRLRRYKRKLRGHNNSNSGEEHAAAYAIMTMPAEEEEVAEDFAPAVVAESTKTVRTQTVAMAVMQLELMDGPVHVFRNAGSGTVNVVYRRADGNIGWIDPAAAAN
ncbi:MAG: ribosome-associated translation inhibitor RaiA [Pseudomonadota bacterium]